MELSGGHVQLNPVFRRFQQPILTEPGYALSFPWDSWTKNLPTGTPKPRFAALTGAGVMPTTTGQELSARLDTLIGNLPSCV